MLDSNIRNRDLNDALLEASNPIAAPSCRKSLRHSFIQAFCGDFDGVSYTLQVLDRDAARSDGHEMQNNIFAFYSLRSASIECCAGYQRKNSPLCMQEMLHSSF